MNKALLIIDPQNDFMDQPWKDGVKNALPVNGAAEDMNRLAKIIEIEGEKYQDIYITLDSHQVNDIAHPSWWIDQKNEQPGPYTLISVEDLENGSWKAANPEMQEYSLYYVKQLAKKNKYQLCIWPEHCLVGTEGHNVWPELQKTILNWAHKFNRNPVWVWKGLNPKTEHYSALKAEVELEDEDTRLNKNLINKLHQYSEIEVAGEALSHCVASTVMDLLDNSSKEQCKKVKLLIDCTSNVTGFEELGKSFLEKATEKGMTIEKKHNLKLKN